MRKSAAVLAFAILAALGGAAGASEDERGAFYAAANLARAGHPAEAAEELLALQARSPADPFADDALLEAAQLYEEKLGDPRRAAETYERLVEEYPSSRLAVRARRRAEELRAGMGPDGRDAAALAEWNDVLYGYARRPRAESIARVERLLREHPEFGGAARATYWLGSAYQQEGRDDDALRRFREVVTRWPESEWATRALKAEGDLLTRREDWAGARRAYQTLRGRGDPLAEQTAAEALAALGRARLRARAATAGWAVLGLFAVFAVATTRRAAGSWGDAGRLLARPPVEAVYLVPVAGLFVIAALTEHQAIGRAVTTIAAGAVAVTWLSGAALEAARARAGRVSLARATTHAAAAGMAVLALCYVALFRHRLIDLVIETLRFGAER